MSAQTPSELLQWLTEKQFLPLPQMEELWPHLPSFATCHALAKELIRRGWITPYQANQILTDNRSALVIGPFRLLDRVGEGAMGQVFRAWHVRLGKFVAVKMLHQNLLANSKAMDRFHQEMKTASQLCHPNIVMMSDAGEVEERPYMVMEFCDGINLSQLVKKHGALPIHLACEYIRQAAIGLQHAADQGVVHRDIKPSNLLLTNLGPNQSALVKILDFGLARLSSMTGQGRLTQVGNLLGTIDYVAPEQIENAQKADVRSDIYSLGCTLFFLLTARAPVSGTSMMEKLSGRLMGATVSVHDYRPEVSAELETVLRRMMAQKREDRFQTATEVSRFLLPFCQPAAQVASGRPVTKTKHGVNTNWERGAGQTALADEETKPNNPGGSGSGRATMMPTDTPIERPFPLSLLKSDWRTWSRTTWLWIGGGVLGFLLLILIIVAAARSGRAKDSKRTSIAPDHQIQAAFKERLEKPGPSHAEMT